jgi:PAS domain S-box-containing protein
MLPLKTETRNAVPARGTTRKANHGRRGGERRTDMGKKLTRVLISDVDPAARSTARSILRGHCHCVEAGSIPEAQKELYAASFDVALCGIEVPGVAGWAFAEEIRANHPAISVVFVTEADAPELAKRAFELGAHGYVVKPYQAGQLLVTIMSAVKRNELEIAQRAHERALRQQLQTVIDNAPISIYVKDRQRRFLAINRVAAAASGLSPEELIGLTVDSFMGPEASEISRAGDRKVLDTGSTYEDEETMLLAGKEKTSETVKFPLLDDDGDVYAVCGISVDVTAKRQAKQLNEELLTTQRGSIEALRASRQETVEQLSRALALHHPGTGEHVERMARIAGLLGEAAGLGPERTELLRGAAPMHDVGKVATPDSILLKPGPLTDAERTEMERHTVIGFEILGGSASELLRLAASVALNHHERFDGTGYPNGIAGEQIPIEARIVAVADVFDALLSDRSYRPAMSVSQTVGLIEEGRGTQFDPKIVDVLLEHLDEALVLRRPRLA